MDIKKSIKIAQKKLGIETLRKHQTDPINSILDGQDTMVIAPTSAGKSAIYQIPALIFPGMTLVIEPTLSLMYDQVNKLKAHGIKAEYIDSVMKSDDCQKILNHVAKGKVTMLFVTPERLQNKAFLKAIKKTDISFVAVDEWLFLKGERKVMVATSAFGLGIDQSSVDLVIHFNLPLSLVDYYQQAGRAGRAGQKAKCILFYCEDDYYKNQTIIEGIADKSSHKAALMALDKMIEYAESKSCLTCQILSALGETMDKTCGVCTNCQKARKKK